MPFIDVLFTKINGNRERKIEKKVEVKASLNFKDPEKDYEDKEKISLLFPFSFSIEYNFADLFFEGFVVYVDEKKNAENLLKNWKKDKNFTRNLYNYALNKCNLKALFFEEILRLPPHIPFPRLKE